VYLLQTVCTAGNKQQRLSLAERLPPLLLLCCTDCSPGFMMNGTLAADSSWCVACPRGQYCPGGSADNPDSRAFNCTPGLATVSEGARSEQQVIDGAALLR
jgi:hypothetical protein